MAAQVNGPTVAVNYTLIVPPKLVVQGPTVPVNYTVQAGSNRLVVGPTVAVNYTVAQQTSGYYLWRNGQVVRPGVYQWVDGRVVNIGPAAATTPAAYPPNYGAVGSYWPWVATTGVPAGTDLTIFDGDLTTTSNNQVIDGVDLRGNLIVKHTGVTFQRGIIRGQSYVPPTQTTNIILVNCTDPNVRNFTIRDSEIYCQAPSQWSVLMDGHDATAERCNWHGGQDVRRYRPRSSTDGNSYCVHRQNWEHDWTWFAVSTDRAASGQTHNDANQLAGAAGVLIEGNNSEGYYGDSGQRQPDLTTNTSTAWAGDNPPVKSNTTRPELAWLMLNVASNGQQVSGLVAQKNRVAGFVTPVNMGDPGLATSNIGTIIQNVFTSDSPANSDKPPSYLRRQVGQTVDFGQDDPTRWNTLEDGPTAGQQLPVRTDA